MGRGETGGGQMLSREADVWGKKAVAAGCPGQKVMGKGRAHGS